LDHRQREHGQEAYRQFLKPCPDTTTFLEPANTLFDHRTTPIAGPIEVGILITLVGLSRDHGTNAMSSKPIANASNAVGFVTGKPSRTLTRPPQRLRDANMIQNRFQLRRFVLLSSRYFGRQRYACTVSDQVELAAESAF
jgi:hypothetical protein